MNQGVEFSVQALRQAGRALQPPFEVLLPDGERLHCELVLRLLPGKRIVARAVWRDQVVLAKLFVAESAAGRHMQRELCGVRALQAAGLKTPGVLAELELPAGGHVLLYQYLNDAESLQAHWSGATTRDAQLEVLGRTVPLIAQMHDSGLKQDDIHLDNFLVWRGDVYCIDGDGVDVRASGSALPAGPRLDNLGLFFAQLPIAAEQLVPDVLPEYLAACAAPVAGMGLSAVMGALARQRRYRQELVLAKTLRDCTAYAVTKDWRRFVSVSRERLCEEMQALIEHPDQPLQQDELLKRGNTATVAACLIGQQRYVMKRYNIKDFWHGLKRALQPSRAWRSWLAGHLLLLLGIPTPTPVLLLEERFGPFRRRAFLLTEAVSGPDARSYFLDESIAEQQRTAQAERVIALLSDLARAQISHGDLKATNLLIGAQGPVLIDLDAMCQHQNARSFSAAFRADLQRFMRNWPQGTLAYTLFAPDVERLMQRTGKR